LRASNDVDRYKDADDSRFLGGEQNGKISSNSRNPSALLKGEGARENTQCRGAIAAPGFIVSLFIWRLRFAKTPLDARGGG
jgi:hypothetical protein